MTAEAIRASLIARRDREAYLGRGKRRRALERELRAATHNALRQAVANMEPKKHRGEQ